MILMQSSEDMCTLAHYIVLIVIVQQEVRSDALRRVRRRVAKGLELRGAGLLHGAFSTGSSAGQARRETESAFRVARPGRQKGSRRSRRLGAGRGAGLRRGLRLGLGAWDRPVGAAGREGRR